MNKLIRKDQLNSQDDRFELALKLFNSGQWYETHEILEEIWYETQEPERTTLQGLLQIAVAELHLERDNRIGATILYGEGIGRLKKSTESDLGLEINQLIAFLEGKLKSLQDSSSNMKCGSPILVRRALRL